MSDDGCDQLGESEKEADYESSTSDDSEPSNVSHNSTESSAATQSSSSANFHCVPTVIDLASLARSATESVVLPEVAPAQEVNYPPVIEPEELQFQENEDILQEESYSEEDISEPIRDTDPSVVTIGVDHSTQETQPVSLYQRRVESSVFCRICHEVGSADNFIAPCGCKGSLTLVHKLCLETWLAESSLSQCEVCGYEYKTKRLPKHNILGSIFFWIFAFNSRQRRLLCWDLFSLMLLVPATVMGTSLTMKVMDKEIPDPRPGPALAYTRILQLSMILATLTLDIGALAWMVLRLQYHCHHWIRWYRTNFKVILVGFPDAKKVEVANHVSSPSVREIQF